MSARRPINQRDTRKLVRDCISYTIHEMSALSRRGIFHFQTSGFGRLLVIDDLALADDERRHLEPFLAASHLVRRLTPAELIDETLDVLDINHHENTEYRSFTNPDFERKPLWMFQRQAWCLPHIFAGLTCPGDEERIALKHYDTIFATSHHDQMRARHFLATRKTPTTTPE